MDWLILNCLYEELPEAFKKSAKEARRKAEEENDEEEDEDEDGSGLSRGFAPPQGERTYRRNCFLQVLERISRRWPF